MKGTVDESGIRVFFAVSPGELGLVELDRLLSELRLQKWGKAPRWVAREGLHMTLRFIASMPEEKISETVEAVAEEVSGIGRFGVELSRLVFFPSGRRPRVLALAAESAPALRELARGVEKAVVKTGFKPERRPFRAHLTLARLNGGPGLAERPPGLARPVAIEVNSVFLYRSRLGRGGPRYTELARLGLRRRG
ncbi:MAG: RNA 2',3'-cyclic phosphodiesterase [Candidatus Binatia bacterium]